MRSRILRLKGRIAHEWRTFRRRRALSRWKAREQVAFRSRIENGTDFVPELDVGYPPIRLGSPENGWCIYPEPLDAHSIVYSFGVGRDITFDRELIGLFDCQVHAFDPTPISQDWLKTQKLPDAFHFHPVGIAAQDGTAAFELPERHATSFTMASWDHPSDRKVICEVKCLSTLLNELQHPRIDLLKMDIEGAEYDVLPDVAARASQIGQLLVEFHHRDMQNQDGMQKTQDALCMLRKAGFRLFSVSESGMEYSFIHE